MIVIGSIASHQDVQPLPDMDSQEERFLVFAEIVNIRYPLCLSISGQYVRRDSVKCHDQSAATGVGNSTCPDNLLVTRSPHL